MNTVDLGRYDHNMIQRGIDFCIPACAYSICKYHDPKFDYTQEYIMSLMVSNATDHMPSFGAMIQFVAPILNARFVMRQEPPHSHQEWLTNIKNEIDDNCPLAIATRVSNNHVHIRTVLGYDDNSGEILLYNPGVTKLIKSQNFPLQKGSQYCIASGIEKYEYQQAQRDINNANDQLIIRPV